MINAMTLKLVSLERDSLIRQEVRAAGQRGRLEKACIDAIVKLGHNIDDVSEASGLTPIEIRSLIEAPKAMMGDLAELSGIC